jgi:hypothetical protein
VISATPGCLSHDFGKLGGPLLEARSAGLLKEAQRAGDVSLLRLASVLYLGSRGLPCAWACWPESAGGERLRLVALSRRAS